MALDHRGANATPASRSVVWDPRDGYRYVDRYTGTDAAMTSAFNAAQASGYRCRIDRDPNGGYSTLEIEVGRDPAGGTDELSNEWSLPGNDLEKELMDHPDVLLAIQNYYGASATPADKIEFRRTIDRIISGEAASGTATTFAEQFTGTHKTTVENLISSLAMRQETYIISQFVLRNTIVVPTNWTGAIDVSNVNKVYTYSELLAAETVDPVLVTSINSLQGQWLKKTPTYEPAGRDKWRIDREWWHADVWSRFYARKL